MKDTDIIQLLEHNKKQTEHLRAIRNWVAFAGIMIIVIPLAIVILFWFVVGIGTAGYY
jgi:hypothetical protein